MSKFDMLNFVKEYAFYKKLMIIEEIPGMPGKKKIELISRIDGVLKAHEKGLIIVDEVMSFLASCDKGDEIE